MNAYVILLFYKFVPIEKPEVIRDEQKKLLKSLNMSGRIFLAKEGINGTVEGTKESVEGYKKALRANPLFADMKFKESEGTGQAFGGKIKIKVRDEVVTLGAGAFDIPKETAYEMPPEELEALYASGEDFVVLDLRNDYEIAVGQFEKTVHPNLHNFRDLPKKLESIAHLKDKKVVTVCTGGIRCEKATCLLKKEGFTNIAQLKDGIHTYMEKFPARHFKGSLFVFDNRMTTPVVEAPERDIIGTCIFCGTKSEDFYSDDSVRPSAKIICCSDCIVSRRESLRNCIETTKEAIHTP
jgi:UPF0176 protein